MEYLAKFSHVHLEYLIIEGEIYFISGTGFRIST